MTVFFGPAKYKILERKCGTPPRTYLYNLENVIILRFTVENQQVIFFHTCTQLNIMVSVIDCQDVFPDVNLQSCYTDERALAEQKRFSLIFSDGIRACQ